MVPSADRNAGGTAWEAFTTSVSGPGQCARASAHATSGTSRPYRSRSEASPTSQATGLPRSRRLMSNRTCGLRAASTATPRPYTVSVGNTTA